MHEDEGPRWEVGKSPQIANKGSDTTSGDRTQQSATDSTPDVGGSSGAAGTSFDGYARLLARAMEADDYHPVVIFGTSNSGKTHLLLSAFATLLGEHRLNTALTLQDPLLDVDNPIATQLHEEARHLFENMTLAFSSWQKIGQTTARRNLPFFVPLEFRPEGKPSVRFAFMESEGEWYAPKVDPGGEIAKQDSFYQPLKREIEDFLGHFSEPITFIYVLPYTQSQTYSQSNRKAGEQVELARAGLAIEGILEAYPTIRAGNRLRDRHLLLLSKWDARSLDAIDDVAALEVHLHEVEQAVVERFPVAYGKFNKLNVPRENLHLSAYCAGRILPDGLKRVQRDSDEYHVITSHHIRLWKWLYKSALKAKNLEEVSPFDEPKEPNLIAKLIRLITGRG